MFEKSPILNHDRVANETAEFSDTRYRRLFATAPDGLIILDALDLTITEVNPSAVELLGYSSEELLGRKLWEVGFFQHQDGGREAFDKIWSGGSFRCEDLAFETNTCEPRVFDLSARADRGALLPVIICQLRDVTDRRSVEAGLRQLVDVTARHRIANQFAETSAVLAEIAGRVARLGGWTIELPERKLTWSDENCAIHEVPPGYQPTLDEGIGYFPPEYRDLVIRYVEDCATNGTPYDFEMPKHTARGRLIWVRSIGEAVRDAEGNIIRIQGAFQDITARKLREAEREALIEELRSALVEVKTLREFLPICSYCLKVRDDQTWSRIEHYISRHMGTKFSHGICPECYETKVTPELEDFKTGQRKP
jgi:PAS domain S-box-containing protein